MPDSRVIHHTPALMGEVDPRTFAGQQVATLDAGENNALITIDASPGVFWDMPAFLHGYGSAAGQTISEHFDLEWQAQNRPGVISVSHDTGSDKIRITSTVNPIRILAGPDNHLLGFDNDNPDAAFSVSVLAPNPYRRGVFQFTQGLDIQQEFQGNPSSTTRVPEASTMHRVQSLITYMRNRTSLTDADNVWSDASPVTRLGICFERRVQHNANPIPDFRALVEADGRVTFNYESGSPGDRDASFWFQSETARRFWARLGGDNSETATLATDGLRYNMTSARPAPCVLALDRGYVEMRRVVRMRDNHAEMSDGSIVTAGLAPVSSWDLTLRAIGPTHGPDASLEQHVRDWWKHSRRALTLYPQWGDGDYALGSCEMRRHVSRSDAEIADPSFPYNTFRTHEAEIAASNWVKRKGGRMALRQTGKDKKRAEKYPGTLDCYQDLKFNLQDDPTR